MDETVGDEVMDATGSRHIPSKECEFILKPGSSDHVEPHEMVTPDEGDHSNSSRHLFTDILDGKHLDRIGSSEHASVSPRCMDDTGVMVEELTLRNYNAENLAVVGTSNNRDRVQSRQNQWQHLYQIASGSGSGNMHGEVSNRDKNNETSSVWEDVGNLFFSGIVNNNRKTSSEKYNEVTGNLVHNDGKVVLDNTSSAGITRTKIISKSGFSEYFIKNTLKGKGVLYRGPMHRGSGEVSGDQTQPKSDKNCIVASDASLTSAVDIFKPPHGTTGTWPGISTNSCSDGICLRDWLEAGKNKANKAENLYIFRQIVELVDFSHSQGVPLKDLRPSCFRLLQSNKVLYLGSSIPTSPPDKIVDQDVPQSVHDKSEKRTLEQDLLPSLGHWAKKQKLSENMIYRRRSPLSSSNSGLNKPSSFNVNKADSGFGPDSWNESNWKHDQEMELKSRSNLPTASNGSPHLSPLLGCTLEVRWYTSPELAADSCSTFSSNIYSLGVLLFELLGSFGSRRSREAALLDLRHRILPPDFLSENPKEAGFCLWLLHPDPSSRPTARQVLQSEVMSNIQELIGDASLSYVNEEDAESELLLHFFLSLKDQKQKDASKVTEEIRCIETDIKEIEKRQIKSLPVLSSFSQESLSARGNSSFHRVHRGLDSYAKLPLVCDEKLTRNIRQLESAYFSMRSNIQFPENDISTRSDQELLRSLENRVPNKEKGKCKTNDTLGGFFNDLCKYARYSRFKVQGILRNGDLTNSANVICSLSFDRDEDYLAAAGVSKKIKIYDFHALSDDSIDIHYPVVEMSNKSKLSCVCWNGYIRNYLASTDYDGVVKLWDAATGQGFLEFMEHNERAWCVDFSRGDPTKFASGSDDRLVKLWSINEKNSLCTIRNNANVCCVQFSAESTYLLAFSSADYKTYCYDLRNASIPWCVLAGHEKAVSYAKFLDAETLVSASTDNTLKVWDLKKTNPNGLSRDACVLTLQGHTNEKNFVGLSVADGYIACGSETNEVYAYYRSLPMPITAQKFGSIDPISGKETENDNGQFVSSVCWRRKSDMVVAANSSGCIKLLQMI